MRTLKVLLAAAVISVLVAPEVDAATYRSRVTINQSAVNAYVGGDVSANLRGCVRKRTVKLFQRTGPDTAEYKGMDKTDADGDWLVSFPAQIGATYYAKATRKVIRLADGTRHTCVPSFSDDYIA